MIGIKYNRETITNTVSNSNYKTTLLQNLFKQVEERQEKENLNKVLWLKNSGISFKNIFIIRIFVESSSNISQKSSKMILSNDYEQGCNSIEVTLEKQDFCAFYESICDKSNPFPTLFSLTINDKLDSILLSNSSSLLKDEISPIKNIPSKEQVQVQEQEQEQEKEKEKEKEEEEEEEEEDTKNSNQSSASSQENSKKRKQFSRSSQKQSKKRKQY